MDDRQPVVNEDWAAGMLKFWSAIICRKKEDKYEDINDETLIGNFLSKRDLTTVESFCKDGEDWTIVLNQVHGASPALRQLHHSLWAALCISGGVNSYLTPPGAVGKAPHVDDHDVFIIHQSGQKVWFLLSDD